MPSLVLLSVVLVAGSANCMIAKGRNGTYARFGLSALQPNVHEPTKRYVDPTSNPIATGLVPADPGPMPPPRHGHCVTGVSGKNGAYRRCGGA